jgi:hypothetical protein
MQRISNVGTPSPQLPGTEPELFCVEKLRARRRHIANRTRYRQETAGPGCFQTTSDEREEVAGRQGAGQNDEPVQGIWREGV